MSVTDEQNTSPPPEGRRPAVSRRRYMVRRIVALALVAVVALGLVRAIAAMLGSDGDGTAETVPTAAAPTIVTVVPTSLPDDGTTPEAAAEGITVEPGLDTTAPEVDSETEGPPSVDNPAEVYIVGDSDAGTFGPYLEQLLDATLIVDTELNYKVSSGLARPDFFDWPAELASSLPDVEPDIVVVTFGGNDSQGLAIESDEFIIGDLVQNTEEWSAEYERRAGDVMDLLLEEGRTVIWVGIPNDDNDDVTARLAIQDQAVKAAAADRPEVVFVDTWTRFSGRDGNWAEFVIDPRDGQGKDVRAADGFHLNVVGAEILALDIAQAVRDDLRARGANV
ncbi:MAG: SGNH/GDSL hydrolase family protein [Ilumatobacteraceae bacterium]